MIIITTSTSNFVYRCSRFLHDAAVAKLREMRSHGVRWLNMRKNIPFGQYAFNWLQQRLLPEGYRAPKGTYKAFGGTPT